METVLITGGGGYLGTVLSDVLLNEGYRVVCLDRLFFGEDKVRHLVEHPDYTLINGDIRYFDEQILEGVDVVIDLAALSNDPLGELVKDKTFQINNEGRQRVCKMVKRMGVSRYILASSCSVYGFNENYCTEESELNPLTTYAEANMNAEAVLEQRDDDFCVTVLRLATAFGVSRRMRFDLAINIMTLRAFKEGIIYVLGQGMQWRPFVHVKDISKVICSVITAKSDIVNGEVFNVGSNDNTLKIINLAYLLRETLPFETAVKVTPSERDCRSYLVSFDKVSKVLSFSPSFSIVDGINEVYQALKQGVVWDSPDTVTVKWYKHLIDTNRFLKSVLLNGDVL